MLTAAWGWLCAADDGYLLPALVPFSVAAVTGLSGLIGGRR